MNRAKPLYCALIVNKAVVQRGYWDDRVDYMECFDTDAEALNRSNANPPVPRINKALAHPTTKAFLLASCASNVDRGTGYSGWLYAGSYGTVCADRFEQYIGGTGDVHSVWLENPQVNLSCPRLRIRENFVPPVVSYIDYSSAFTNFIYVAWHQWWPKGDLAC